MTMPDYKDIDLTLIETNARKLRAEYLAGFFKRRSR